MYTIYYILNCQMQPLRHKVAFHHGVAGMSCTNRKPGA